MHECNKRGTERNPTGIWLFINRSGVEFLSSEKKIPLGLEDGEGVGARSCAGRPVEDTIGPETRACALTTKLFSILIDKFRKNFLGSKSVHTFPYILVDFFLFKKSSLQRVHLQLRTKFQNATLTATMHAFLKWH